ncbi:universal stress protein [Halorarum salinum]|uniref:Universal stress protein n=1 Tax=Halorarum salinum TaxID=2743089 RepID=A0A7D5QJ41_9EURY|nr:universal stress protein [Halobaculum salinum]QLG63842.1 universal stress protein [Halobaculum salinum]
MTVIACVDRSEQAAEVVAEAARLGEAFGEPVHAVHVLTREEFVDLERTSVDDTGRAMPLDRIREVAARIAEERVEDAGVTAEAVGLVGDPSDEIVNYADEHGASYVVVGGRKHSPVGKALFGSVAQSILLDAHHPVVALAREE